ncbi:MAG: hypothetical protein GVY13_02680 [Alphaproteobacteria bacterium]|nr:hypothetical protein [Alphaproteobacteria bacterium]
MPKFLRAMSLFWRELGPEDLTQIHSLHVTAAKALGRADLVRADSEEFFAAILAGNGRICGVVDGQGLAGYGLLQWGRAPVGEIRTALGLSDAMPFALLGGASVRPDLWGNGLHEGLIERRVILAREIGVNRLGTTSAPGNTRSWTNLMNRGFEIRALIEIYGGNLRYVLYRETDKPTLPNSGGLWCPFGDIATQRHFLRGGLSGSAWRVTAEGDYEIAWSRFRRNTVDSP